MVFVVGSDVVVLLLSDSKDDPLCKFGDRFVFSTNFRMSFFLSSNSFPEIIPSLSNSSKKAMASLAFSGFIKNVFEMEALELKGLVLNKILLLSSQT